MPISNWYNKQKQQPKSRYDAIIYADIFVNTIEDNGLETEQAKQVLTNFLPEDGQGIRINNFEINPHGKLV